MFILVVILFFTLAFSGCLNKDLVSTITPEEKNNLIVLKGKAVNSKIVKPMTQMAKFAYDTTSHENWFDYQYNNVNAKITKETSRFIYFELELELGKDIDYDEKYHFRAGMYYDVGGSILPDEPVFGEDLVFET